MPIFKKIARKKVNLKDFLKAQCSGLGKITKKKKFSPLCTTNAKYYG